MRLGPVCMERPLPEGVKTGWSSFKWLSSDFNTVLNYHVKVGEQQTTDLARVGQVVWPVAGPTQRSVLCPLPAIAGSSNDKREVSTGAEPGPGACPFSRPPSRNTNPPQGLYSHRGHAFIAHPVRHCSRAYRVNRKFDSLHPDQERTVWVRTDFEYIATACPTSPVKRSNTGQRMSWNSMSRPGRDTFCIATGDAKLPREYYGAAIFITSDDADGEAACPIPAVGNTRDPWAEVADDRTDGC